MGAKKNNCKVLEEVNPLQESHNARELEDLHAEFYGLQQAFGIPRKNLYDGHVFRWPHYTTIEIIAPWKWGSKEVFSYLNSSDDFALDFFFCCINRGKANLARWLINNYANRMDIKLHNNQQLLNRRIEQINNAIHNITTAQAIDTRLLVKSLQTFFSIHQSGTVMCCVLPALEKRFAQNQQALYLLGDIKVSMQEVGHQKRTGLQACIKKRLCDVIIQHKNL